MCEIKAMLAVERVVPVQISLDSLEYHTHVWGVYSRLYTDTDWVITQWIVFGIIKNII